MKFGLFYELQLPKPADADDWDPDAERRIFHEMLDQVELADSLGFDYVFEVEHHFLEEYSHSSAPEMMMAALSQRKEIFSIYYPDGSMLAETRNPASRTVLEYTEWDPLARIEISAVPGRRPVVGTYASLFGENPAFLSRYRKLITQNNFAFTFFQS